MGSVRRECLDHILILSEAHLRRVLSEYVTYFNRSRPHQGINQQVPDRESSPDSSAGTAEEIVSFPVFGGLHHEYRRAAESTNMQLRWGRMMLVADTELHHAYQ